jgi:eukaryotic-like serine/threonine-protein kinase
MRDQPDELGPFVISRVLAQGGMSVVYFATHKTTGEPVALKTVRAPDEVYLSSLRREIHALSRLRHPGIVRIVAEGVSAGVPWYAMELLVGETLADLHAKIWSRPSTSTSSSERTTVSIGKSHPDDATPIPPTVSARAAGGHLKRVLTIARRMCTPLAFLHGEGIVHCDLKPHNVFIRPGDLPVLVDFGLAWRAAGVVGREVAEVVTKVAGTPSYMAPEQIRLQPIDPRTDLYALGCVLYELVTSQPPFHGGADILVRHLTREPTPPSHLVEGVPEELDRLIVGLLAKRPRDRVGYAEDVSSALERLGAEAEPFTPVARARPWLYRPELSGRDAVLQEVLASVERPRYGSGAFVILAGESGIGKTYLATEIARRAGSELKVVASACAPRGAIRRGGGELEPFQELFGAIADRCTALGVEACERILGARGKILAPYAPHLLKLTGVAEQADPPELTGAAAREQLFAALRDTLAEFSREQPLLLLLDDLQWADELALAFLASLPDGFIDEHPVSILATYRTDERSDAIDAILARKDVHRVTVGRLDERTVRDVVRDMLAIDSPPDAFVRFLSRQSEGNPFFVAEYLRTAVAEGVLKRASMERLTVEGNEMTSGVFEQLAVPRTIRELIGRRMQGLTPPARRLCEVASVIGRGFDAATLQAAAASPDNATMEGIAELLARQVIEPEPGGRFRFVHDKLREVAYDQLDGTRRIELHHAVASAIEKTLGEDDAAVLAHHWSLARVDDKALFWLERAAFRSLEHAAYRESADLFRQALLLAARAKMPPLRRARLDAGLARASFASGDHDVADGAVQRALTTLDRPLPSSRTGWGLLLGRELITQVAHLGGFARKTADATARDGMREAAIIAGLMTQRFFYADDALAMLSTALMSVNLAERAASESKVSRPLTLVGFVAGVAGRERLAASYFRRARAGAEAANDPIELAFALAVEGVHHCGFGRWSVAASAFDRGRAAIQGVHDPFMSELLLTARAHVEFYTGRVVEAEEHFEELLRSARSRGSQQHETWALFSIARSKIAGGKVSEAHPLLISARDALSRKPELQSEIICYGLLAEAEARLSREADALQAADATVERIARARPTGFAALEGYRGALAAYLALGMDSRAASVTRALAKFARVFPMARPALLIAEGELLLRRGARFRARRAFERASVLARAMTMPREEAEALARL